MNDPPTPHKRNPINSGFMPPLGSELEESQMANMPRRRRNVPTTWRGIIITCVCEGVEDVCVEWVCKVKVKVKV